MAAGDIHYNDAGLPIGIEGRDGQVFSQGVVDHKGIRSAEEVAEELRIQQANWPEDWWEDFQRAFPSFPAGRVVEVLDDGSAIIELNLHGNDSEAHE